MKNIKKVKKRRPLSGIGHFLNFGKCKKILNSKKKWQFYVGGVIKTEKCTFFIKKHTSKGVFTNCKDVPCKITTFEETNANDIGCAKVKVAILHGRS